MYICCNYLSISLIYLFTIVACENIHKRYEYKYSFKGPYLAQKDNQVPFWSYSGSAIASEESFRITPSLRSQKGQAWAKNPTNFEWWEVELVFRVNGRGRIGADGLAFWFTTVPGKEGPVFGSTDMWNGFGLFFDSFDNDNKRNNPYIMGMANNGSVAYDHENDGLSQQMGGCLRDFRNKAFPIRAKIEYFKNVFTVFIHNGMTDNDHDYEMCYRSEGIHLPAAGYFGVTAATGGLADDHDVLKLSVHSLLSQDDTTQVLQNEEEELKFKKEFDEYQRRTQKAKDEYIAEHPDSAPKDAQQEYETSEQRELRQIFQGQAQIFDVLRRLQQKLDEIVGKQERTLSLVSGSQVGAPSTGQAPPPPPAGAGEALSRNEINYIISNQRDVSQSVKDIQSVVSDVRNKNDQLLGLSQRAQGSAQPTGATGGYDFHVTLKEMNEGLNIVKRDLTLANQRLTNAAPGSAPGGCPNVPCVSTTFFAIFMTIQAVALVAYFIYRDSKEAQAKKFY